MFLDADGPEMCKWKIPALGGDGMEIIVKENRRFVINIPWYNSQPCIRYIHPRTKPEKTNADDEKIKRPDAKDAPQEKCGNVHFALVGFFLDQ